MGERTDKRLCALRLRTAIESPRAWGHSGRSLTVTLANAEAVSLPGLD